MPFKTFQDDDRCYEVITAKFYLLNKIYNKEKGKSNQNPFNEQQGNIVAILTLFIKEQTLLF